MRRRTLLHSAPAAALLAAKSSRAAPPATIGIMGGQIDGTYMRAASDLTSVLNSDTLRIVPILGKGSLQNIGDLLHLKGVDLAFVNANSLLYAKQEGLYANELQKLCYICKVYDDDVHILARPEITSLSDLNGKPVNIDTEGAGSNLTSRMVFRFSGINPEFRTEEQASAQVSLLRGDIAAMVYVAGKPVRLLETTPADTGLHFLNVPLNRNLAQMYLPGGMLKNTDYPKLIGDGQVVQTIGVGVTLAAFNWEPNTDRYRTLVSFVDSFFTKFPALLKPPHHPVWQNVNLEAEQPGWPRFKPATDWLTQNAARTEFSGTSLERSRFEAFLAEHGGTRMTPAERDATWQYVRTRLQSKSASR